MEVFIQIKPVICLSNYSWFVEAMNGVNMIYYKLIFHQASFSKKNRAVQVTIQRIDSTIDLTFNISPQLQSESQQKPLTLNAEKGKNKSN